MSFEVKIDVYLRAGISDPEGHTIADAASALGYGSVSSVAAGKSFKVDIDTDSPDEAREVAHSLASRLLSNPVIQDFAVVSLERKGQ